MVGDQKFDKLKSFYKQLLPSITEESWNATRSLLTIRVFKKREYIIKEGMICNHVSFINYGLVRFFYLSKGVEKNLGFCNENNYISEYQSFLTRKPARAFIQALEDTEVIETNYESLQMLYRTAPEANILGRMIAEQLYLMSFESTLADANRTVEQRYKQIIEEYPWLLQRVPQYMIASYLRITPEALSRIKARMSKQKTHLVRIN